MPLIFKFYNKSNYSNNDSIRKLDFGLLLYDLRNTHNFRTNNSNNINHINTIPNEEEYFNYNSNKIQELSKDEKIIFGDRIMKGYIKKKLLGKGDAGLCGYAQNLIQKYLMIIIQKKNMQ